MTDSRKRFLFEKQARIAQAIGHPLRLEIIDFLKDGEQCVCDIAEHIGAQRSNVSRHLSLMVAAGVLEHRKVGLKVIYWLKCTCILDFFACISGVLKEQARESKKLLAVL
ncbi:MAG: metalloregulator ArsR/SmtB family transcription factor [Sedimentisphaerales bacterium]|nr:metalloregulator ArsR/SmtB family transcription factor [Sedimentisphaerales bacterium]